MKMYILIQDWVPKRMAPVISAHASLKCYLEFKDHETAGADIEKWLEGSFHKVICEVNESEWNKAIEVESNAVFLTESSLAGKEVALAFAPREEYNKAFKFFRMWKP